MNKLNRQRKKKVETIKQMKIKKGKKLNKKEIEFINKWTERKKLGK